MKVINKITDNAFQKAFLIGNPGQRITVDLRYLPSQQGWLIDVAYLDFVAKGIPIVASPNMLRQFKNVIPFGIACVTSDGLDVYYPDDFSTGRANLLLLTAADVETIENTYKHG